MKKWIKFKFKNKLWLYVVALWVLVGFLSYLMIKDGENWLAIALLALTAVASSGGWFGYHYGIRITDKNYLIICSSRIKKFDREQVTAINFYFLKEGKNYVVCAEVIIKDQPIEEFVWTDVHSVKGRKLLLDVTEENAKEIATTLSQHEKIHVKFIHKTN